MRRVRNPFIHGPPVPPSYFVGREREIQEAFKMLRGFHNLAVDCDGELRMGLTSFLYFLIDEEYGKGRELKADREIVLLSCQSIPREEPNFGNRFWTKVVRCLQKRDLPPRLRRDPEKLNEEQPAFEALYTWLGVLGKERRKFLLILDELEWCIHAEFVRELEVLVNHPSHTFQFVVATRRKLAESCDALAKRSVRLVLRPFSRKEAEQLVDRCLKGTGMEFTKKDRDFVFEVSKGHPYWLQNACYKLFGKKLELAGNS